MNAEKYVVRPRVERIREAYRNDTETPTKFENFNHQTLRVARAAYLFAEGWRKYSQKTTTRIRRACSEAHVLDCMEPVINDDELIVGCPDFTPLNEQEQQMKDDFDKWGPITEGRYDHMGLDLEKLLRVGVNGLIKEIRTERANLNLDIAENVSKDEFYEGCLIELEALIRFQEKYHKHALALAEKAEGQRKDELLKIADILSRVPAQPAKTFYEALESMHFYCFPLWGLFLIGRPDQYLLPYYRADVESGRLTEEDALELIDCFCLHYNKYIFPRSSIGFMIGGHDVEGNLVENELTWLFLRSIAHTRMPYPSIGLAVSKNSSDAILDLAIENLRKGYSHPALFNDDTITEALVAAGFDERDTSLYVHSACVELTISGKSASWVVSPYHNTVQILVDLLREQQLFTNVDELLEAYAKRLRKLVIKGSRNEDRMQLERMRNGGNPLRASCLVHDCIKRGMSLDMGGAKYNPTMPNFLGISNMIDSVSAINTLVFENKELTITQFLDILDKDYEGNEPLRQKIINKVPHFGTNDEFTDQLAKRIYHMIADSCKDIPTIRHSKNLPSAFSFLEHMWHGQVTQATPDGRKAGYPLNDGSSPVQGREINGPTASILSSTAWDHRPYIGGIAVNMKLSPKAMSGESLAKSRMLIRTFMKRGGHELQISCVDRSTLIAARENPEQHRDLLVRIGGYSDYFTAQTPELQQEIIDRTEHEV